MTKNKTMSQVSFPFKRTNRAAFHRPATQLTEDSLYWKKFGSPVLVKEFGAIDYLDFNPVEPYYFAATCSVRVQIYNGITKLVTKNISKFVEAAYGGNFRADGRLIVAGSEEGNIKLFDIQSKNVLRVFTGHSAPVHRTYFAKDQVKLLSFSDDKTVSLWDIAAETRISTFTDHSDYVRSGAPSPISPHIILSGGYDHLVKLYDTRTNETILTVNHGSPVESTLFLPSGGIFLSAGGTEIKVWDVFNGGKQLSSISQHHKTVTTLRLASNNSRLLSASLDRHVKIYDISTFKVVHNIDFPNAILSMAISDKDDFLAVGMVDGVISIRKKEEAKIKEQKKAAYKFAPDHIPSSDTNIDIKGLSNSHASSKKQSKYDVFLRKKNFVEALSHTLGKQISSRHPERTVIALQELLRLKTLHGAMLGLSDKCLENLLQLFNKNMGVQKFTRVIIDSINVLVDVYGNRLSSLSERNITLYNNLVEKIQAEIDVCRSVCEIQGSLSLIVAGSQVNSSTDILQDNFAPLPSTKAQMDLIIDV